MFINTVLYFTGFRHKDNAYKSFTIYLLVVLVIQVGVEVYAFNNSNNHFLSTYYLFFQFISLTVFFYNLFFRIKRKVSRGIKFAGIVIGLILAVQYAAKPGLYFRFNPAGFLLTSAAIIVYAVRYLYENISCRLPFFAVTAGMLVYFMSSTLIFASATLIVAFNDAVNIIIWQVNALLFIIYQLLISWEWTKNIYLKRGRQG